MTWQQLLQVVERFARAQRRQVTGVNEANWEWQEPESDDSDDDSRLLDDAVREHLLATSSKPQLSI